MQAPLAGLSRIARLGAWLLAERGWKLFPEIDCVYVNRLARTELGWQPKYVPRRLGIEPLQLQ
jgi:hypothetical protein